MTAVRKLLKSLTHSGHHKLSKTQVAEKLEEIKNRLIEKFQSTPDRLAALLEILEDLNEFELGRFCIQHKGALSGYWTWYIILGFNNTPVTSELERFMLEKAPAVLSTRERFGVFQKLLIKHIQSNSVVCSIPCGVMADLLTLNLPSSVENVCFVGIDLDETVLQLAKDLAQQLQMRRSCQFFSADAWELKRDDKFIENEFDVVTTNGLNIYEKDDSRVVALYRGLHRALKVGGRLICSALTPPQVNQEPLWNLSADDQANLGPAGDLFKIVLDASWANLRSPEKTCEQLMEAGFDQIEIHWDTRKMFPAFTALKPGL